MKRQLDWTPVPPQGIRLCLRDGTVILPTEVRYLGYLAGSDGELTHRWHPIFPVEGIIDLIKHGVVEMKADSIPGHTSVVIG